MQPHRAAAWLYDVINVVIEALEMEGGLLLRGSCTWRFYNQELEHIKPIANYLNRDGRFILRDLVMAKPEVGPVFAKHDELRAQVVDAATAVYKDGLADPALRLAVDDARAKFLAKNPTAKPTGAFPDEKHIDLVIEHLINEVKELPQHYTDSEFWAAHRTQFVFFAPPSLAKLRTIRAAYLKFDVDTVAWLEQFSFQLCNEHGIPAAPSGSVSL